MTFDRQAIQKTLRLAACYQTIQNGVYRGIYFVEVQFVSSVLLSPPCLQPKRFVIKLRQNRPLPMMYFSRPITAHVRVNGAILVLSLALQVSIRSTEKCRMTSHSLIFIHH